MSQSPDVGRRGKQHEYEKNTILRSLEGKVTFSCLYDDHGLDAGPLLSDFRVVRYEE